VADRFQILGPPVGLDVLEAFFDRRAFAGFGNFGNPRGQRVQIDIRRYRQEGFFIKDGDALEASLEETSETIPPTSQPADQGRIG
jgi:hypothetical protein